MKTKASEKYKEIFKLKKLLELAGIPFDFYEMDAEARTLIPEWEHWHINYPSKEECVISVVEGFGTYGEQNDRLEIMNKTVLNNPDGEDRCITGYHTAEEAFNIIKKLESKRSKKSMKVIKMVDEETLEITEVMVPDKDSTEIAEYTVEGVPERLIRQALDCDPEEFATKYREYKTAEAEFNKLYDPFKTNLIKLHEAHPYLPKRVVVGGVTMTYVSPSTRTTLDSKKLKEEEPELAKKFTKTTEVKGTVRIEKI